MITVYGLMSSKDGVVRYIGQSSTFPLKRLKEHIKDALKGEDTHKARWIRKVLRDGYQIQFTVLKENAVWNVDEIAFIKHYKNMGFSLVNSTDGGDGTINLNEYSRVKISKSLIGNSRMKGIKHSEATIEKISISSTGKKRSDETKIKISEIHKGKIVSEQSRMKMSISQRKRKGRPISNETRLKLSAARKGKKHSEETKAKMSASAKGKNTWCKGRKLSTESINKIRIALLGKKRPPHVGMAVAAANKRRALA